MSNTAAKVHSHQSNRAKGKQALERKAVFKPALDTPFQIKWPSVPINLQNAALSRLILALEGVSSYHTTRDTASRKRKRMLRAQAGATKRMKYAVDDASATIQSSPIPQSEDSDSSSPPPVLPHLTIGINQVTKRLEAQARAYRESITLNNTTGDPPTHAPIRIVFICRADIDPPLLIAHIPTLIASSNSSRRTIMDPTAYPPIKLVPLPLGAEMSLAEATGLRRLSIIALDTNTPDLDSFDSLLDSVPILRASWLTQAELPTCSIPLVPTHIKQIRTTTPKDMKAAKEQRTKGRAQAKQRKNQHSVVTVSIE